MCGIAGLFIKNPALQLRLGSLLADMLVVLSDRGPDSTGFAIYGDGTPETVKVTLRTEAEDQIKTVVAALEKQFGALEPIIRSNHAIVAIKATQHPALQAFVGQRLAEAEIVGAGSRMEIYKEVGLPAQVTRRFDLAAMTGTHAIGHTRMATESAVTTRGAHPFSTGTDQCLVHNGSLSNHNAVRRDLRRNGLSFTTDNDSEVAAGYLTWRMREGATLKQALAEGLNDLDGFYTFVVGTESGFAVLRDPISCKPAVMAETDDYVAFGSEYRALDVLPGIKTARMFEPEPAKVYAWETSLMPNFDLSAAPLRDLNATLHRLPFDTNETHWSVSHPGGKHAIACGLDKPITVEIDGHVGYYCGGMNHRATIVVRGNAGVGVGENMMSGEIRVNGDASQAAGATGRGGLLVIDGNASARCGISMKGIDIVVKGSIGPMSAFMAQAGNLVVLGDAGDALGDSIYEARLFVRGAVASLGADCIEKNMDAADRAALDDVLAKADVEGVNAADFRFFGSARRLYHFHVDNVEAY